MIYPDLPGPCTPLPGDLLFQHTSDEPDRAAISRIFSGIHNFVIDHVALCVAENEVVEAIPPAVRRISLARFLENSCLDLAGQPRVLVCRVDKALRKNIGSVIAIVCEQTGMPYNETYMPCADSWYCSSLITHAWRCALEPNGGTPVFRDTPLEFRDPDTGLVMEFWKQYYQERNMEVPQGLPGSHPALLSRSESLHIVGSFGTFQTAVSGLSPVEGISMEKDGKPAGAECAN